MYSAHWLPGGPLSCAILLLLPNLTYYSQHMLAAETLSLHRALPKGGIFNYVAWSVCIVF